MDLVSVVCACGERVEIPAKIEGDKKEIKYQAEVVCLKCGRIIYHFWVRCPDCDKYIVVSACESTPGGSLVVKD